jgi:hypothetical protein
MTSGHKGDTHMPVALEPVPPSWLVHNVMRPLTRLLNPLSVKLAGGPGFRMAGRIHHVGRRSGREFVTPIGVRLKDGEILIPLTFGNGGSVDASPAPRRRAQWAALLGRMLLWGTVGLSGRGESRRDCAAMVGANDA